MWGRQWYGLVPSGTTIDFIGRRRICAVLSIGLLLVSLGAGLVRGVNFGIDFVGGTEVQLRFSETAPADEGSIREVVSSCGIQDATVVMFGAPTEFLVKFGAPSEELVNRLLRSEACPLTASERSAVESLREDTDAADVTGQVVTALGYAISNGVSPVEIDRVEFVGPRVGAELREDGASALGLQRVLGLGSYQTAWTWLQKLRRSMVRPGRERLRGRPRVRRPQGPRCRGCHRGIGAYSEAVSRNYGRRG